MKRLAVLLSCFACCAVLHAQQTASTNNNNRINLATIWQQSNFGLSGLSPRVNQPGVGNGLEPWRLGLQLKFKVNDLWRLSVGAELVDWDLQSAPPAAFLSGHPSERWYNVGLGYNLNQMARLSFLWQFNDAQFTKGVAMPAVPYTNRTSGNVISTTLTIKF